MNKSLQYCVDVLNENDASIKDQAAQALLNLCAKILKFPNEEKYRIIYLNDSVVTEKLLPASGAMECLFEIGFIEDDDHLLLPRNVSLTKLESLQKLLSAALVLNINSKKSNIKTVKELSMRNDLFNRIIKQFNRVLTFEDPSLQEKAKKVIPLSWLEIRTIERMRKFQKDIKIGSSSQSEQSNLLLNEHKINIKDLFLMELLHWFKYDFFQWVNSPLCRVCNAECSFERIIRVNNQKYSRIEIHRCNCCNTENEFRRYTDVEILLETRCGRCGEWANMFTFLCRTLGYDARLVYDVTDHLWTEIWSITENKWIHIDPCENTIDQPLMYERGWQKELSYIMAYSKDEVQDVTWRYTRKLTDVLQRRILCSEEELLEFLYIVNEEHQNFPNSSKARKEYVIKRKLLELMEMLYVPDVENVSDNKNYQERTSGSYAWKLARGEIKKCNRHKNHIWNVSKYGNEFILQYFIVNDIYNVVDSNGQLFEQISGWQEGVNFINGEVFRKVEDDWKMVYLASSPGFESTCLRWSFESRNSQLCIETFKMQAKIATFHGASVVWEIEGLFPNSKNDNSVTISIRDCSNFGTKEFNGATKIHLTARLLGGNDKLGWQYAQLFRESLNNSKQQSLIVNIKLRGREN